MADIDREALCAALRVTLYASDVLAALEAGHFDVRGGGEARRYLVRGYRGPCNAGPVELIVMAYDANDALAQAQMQAMSIVPVDTYYSTVEPAAPLSLPQPPEVRGG